MQGNSCHDSEAGAHGDGLSNAVQNVDGHLHVPLRPLAALLELAMVQSDVDVIANIT